MAPRIYFFVSLMLLLAACRESGASEAVDGNSALADGTLPPAEGRVLASTDNRFCADVEGLEFSEEFEDRRILPSVRLRDRVSGLVNPGGVLPTVSYTYECGNDGVVEVFTMTPGSAETSLFFERANISIREFGFNPGGLAEKETSGGIGFEVETRTQVTYSDHVRGVNPEDPDVISYQWASVPFEGSLTLRTGAWVATSFETDAGIGVEVLVIAGFEHSESFPWISDDPSRFATVEDLLNSPNDPTLNWRYECVADAWELIRPAVTEYQGRLIPAER